MNEILDEVKIKNERTFGLTILCIISFLVIGILTAASLINIILLLSNYTENSFLKEMIYMAIPGFVSFFIILCGTIQYWYLKKNAFYILFAGTLFPLFALIHFSYFIITNGGNNLSDLVIPFTGILLLSLFIFLYYRNNKYLTQ